MNSIIIVTYFKFKNKILLFTGVRILENG